MRNQGKRTGSAAAVAALALALGACAVVRTAPPPPMGDVSGAWLLETDGRPIRIVRGEADTVTVTVSREPLVVRQGEAVSDSSITLAIAGVVVVGGRSVASGIRPGDDAELVTAGPMAGWLTFSAPMLSFQGKWTEDGFAGTYRVDRKQAGKDVVVLDAPREWRMRRIGGPR